MIKKYLTAGLLLWLPLVITLWVIESVIRWSDVIVALLPPAYRPDTLFGFHIPGFGLLIAVVVIFGTGVLVANYIGQAIVKFWEALLSRIPLVRPIYSGVKQIASTILSDNTDSFKEVVLVEFPQKGQWTLGFIVGTPSAVLKEETQVNDLVTVYVPTAPNPTSGYVIMVSAANVRKTSVSVDAAFKFHLSLGVMTPEVDLSQAQNHNRGESANPPDEGS